MEQWGSLCIQTEAPCRVFVSYAHRDELESGFPSRFMQELRNLLHSLRSRGVSITDEQIFYDADRLLQVEDWSPAIAKALAECEVFILLVSSHAMASAHCIPTELQTVVNRNVPVVPVLLHRTADWINRPVFEDRPKPTLGGFHSGGLPMGAGNNVQAISDWSNREAAWAKVGEDLLRFLEPRLRSSDARTVPKATGIDFRTPSIPPDLLPYFCDQQTLEKTHRDLVRDWREQAGWALVVLYRGCEQDGLTSLGRRLRRNGLAPVLPALGAHQPLEWPDPTGQDQVQPLLHLYVERLFEALQLSSLPSRRMDEAATQLADGLREHDSTPHLHGMLMPKDFEASVVLLNEFMAFLESAAARAGPSSVGLVIDLKLEMQATHRAEAIPSLANTTALSGRRAWLREMAPPEALDRDDITKWHDKFHEDYGLCREALNEVCRTYFEPPGRSPLDWLRPWRTRAVPELRLRKFAELVKPLLSQTP